MNMTKTLRTPIPTILAAAGLLLSGCYLEAFFPSEEEPVWSEPPAPVYPGGTLAPLSIEGSTLQGSMGAVRSPGGGVWLEEGSFDGITTSVHIESSGEGWAMMSLVTIQDNLATMEPGTVLTRDYDEPRQPGLLGCAGLARGAWEFDRPADEVTITVSEGSTPNSRRCDVTATFVGDGTTPAQVAVVSFEVAAL